MIQRNFSGKERLQATASDKAKYFSLKNKKKTVKIIRVYGAHCHIVFLLSGCFFLKHKENWYFNNKCTSISYGMALHFPHFHHHIELFDYLTDLISEQILEFYAECNFCNMHCSCNKWNCFQLNLNDLTLRLFAQLMLLLSATCHFWLMWLRCLAGALEHQKYFLLVSRGVTLFW